MRNVFVSNSPQEVDVIGDDRESWLGTENVPNEFRSRSGRTDQDYYLPIIDTHGATPAKIPSAHSDSNG